jgi:hypothetical protein
MKRNFCKLSGPTLGNSLVEYALPLGLLAIVVLVGAGLVGSNLTQWIPSMANGTMKNDGNSKSLRLRPLGSNPYTQTVLLTLSDGSSLDLENYPTDIRSLVETLGPNGTTDLLVDAMRQLAQKLLAKGEITQAQANQLMALANNGHSWANTQGLVESVLSDSGGDEAVFDNNVRPVLSKIFEQQLSMNEIAPEAFQLFSITATRPIPMRDAQGVVMKDEQGNYLYDNTNPQTRTYIPLQVDFANSYAHALKSGALQNPGVKTLVDSLSKNIFNLGSASIVTANMITYTSDRDYQLNPSQYNQTAVKLIHNNASNICAVGGGNDSGISCPSNRQNRGGV